ncbi:MAG: HAD family phosphatase [Actinomycetota bacterium]|nr:HAD family phosphatase [Actinomycetota bacterium]
MPPRLGAVLFDMDGLLVDTEPLWTQAQVELAERLGSVWRPEIKARVAGTRVDVAVPIMLAELGHAPEAALVDATTRDLLARMVDLYAGPLELLPGAGELVAALRRDGVPTALVSSSYRVLVEAVVRRLDLAFDLVLGGDEVGRAKPDPEPYLTACAGLGVAPHTAVVLEDSPSGVASGEAAGCTVVAVPNVAGVALSPRPRRVVVDSLARVAVDDLRALVGAAAPGQVAEPSAR